jgi:hypothetical protein
MGDNQTVQPTQSPIQPFVAAGGEYSFDQIQKTLFADSAGTMRLAGMAAFVFGVLQLFGGTVCILAGTLPGAICMGFSGFLTLVVGTSIRNAGNSLRAVALRSDGQIPSVMSAISDVRRVFRFQAVLFILGSLGIILGVLIAYVAQLRP